MSPRSGLRLCLALVLAGLTFVPAARAETAEDSGEDPGEDPAALCERAIVNGARRGGVPPEVLHAVALTETGRRRDGRMRAWPWAVNREGKGYWFQNRAEALAFAKASLAEGRTSFDVGCVQINYRWHGRAFPSVDAMFDPEYTATYAAQFLRTLYEERGSWSAAAGAYHSLSPALADVYRQRFDRLLANLEPGALTEAETLVAAAVPEGRFTTRQARREAQRRAMAERIRAAGPPPEPMAGGIAGALFVPAAGSLLVQGTPLLSQGQPLISSAKGRALLMALSLRGLYQPTVMLAMALMAVIAMMVLPMPAWILDLGLAASFAIAILIFTITLFIQRPLDFSAFPTVLLASLMLRLSLNVSSTKLIIGQGHTGTKAAGHVIEGFAMFIMGGSVFLGLVVFGVLLIVNFIVITKGAGRMAEVGARFALDGMPGKQLAIDSDMAAGAISHAEARERRRIEQEETTFFGSLDGASKFVKGDAVAGLLITLLNLVMGLAMGVLVHGMPIRDAFETYSILTVGDGLVTQIPAVIISIASAMLLSKGGLVGSTDRALIRQLGGYPTALGTVAVLMALFAFIPGLPFVPFLIGAGCLAGAAWVARQTRLREAAAAAAPPEARTPSRKSLGDLLDIDEIHMEFAPNLVPVVMDEATGLDARILNMRNHIATEFGLILPEIRLTDNPGLAPGSYAIRVQGVEVARSAIETDQVLVLLPDDAAAAPPGRSVAEPVYGAPARWIAPALQEEAALMGLSVVTPTEVVATHLLEIVKANFGRLFTRRSLRKLLDEFTSLTDSRRAEANRKMLDEFVPDKVPIDTLQSVLRLLLEERVSIRNLPLILEAVAEAYAPQASVEVICEHVRHRLGFQLTAGLQEADGALPLIQLSPSWEELFQSYQLPEGSGIVDVALPPAEFNRLANSIAEKIAHAGAQGRYPAVVTSTKRRRFLHTVLTAKGIRNPVLSFEEIGTGTRPAVLGLA